MQIINFIQKTIQRFKRNRDFNNKKRTRSLPRENKIIEAINYRLFNIFNQN